MVPSWPAGGERSTAKNPRTRSRSNHPGRPLFHSDTKSKPAFRLVRPSSFGTRQVDDVGEKKFSFLAVVDVGANVGDTACIIKTAEEVPILCIEGDEYIFDFLQKNIAQFQMSRRVNFSSGKKPRTSERVLKRAAGILRSSQTVCAVPVLKARVTHEGTCVALTVSTGASLC
jgi:hypothetical protein